ncbi:adenylate/guanylate cyclase domain-containing protein [Robertkochia flava]|uniref:adenylate/guanylate cyclase domain-containing protein n=1 Tax=Robertkochia flava TaxID=3447986 RepID=UPI001CC946D9|nr:adenylate/guanylate cyclase domain-containing protein [Robertkochia marina]
MKKALYYVLFVILLGLTGLHLPINSYGQESDEKDLAEAVASAKNDSLKVDALNALGSFYTNSGEFDKAHNTLQEAIDLARNAGYLSGEAEALKFQGISYGNQSNMYDAIRYTLESLEIYKRLGNTLGIANLESNLGVLFLNEGDPVAIDYLIPALRKAEARKDTTRIVSVLLNLGAVYGNFMGEPERAMEYYKRSREYLDAGFKGMEELQIVYDAGMAEYNLINENYEAALEQYEKLLPLDEGTNFYAETLLSVGEAYEGLGNMDKAREFYLKSIESAKQWRSDRELVEGLSKLGSTYIKTANSNRGLDYLQEALMISDAADLVQSERDVYFELFKAYEYLGQYDKALESHKNYLRFKDSIFNIKANDKIRYAQLNFDLEKKESKIELLERETEITELQQKRQKSVTLATVAVAVLLLMLALGMFNRYKFIKRANNLINEEKERSDNLLLNILPEETAQELKQKGRVEAKRFESVTVMFTDFVGFTKTSETMSPEELVKNVDHFFSKFDAIIEKYGLEKIKTIGDAYMCAGGLPFPTEEHPRKMIMAALEILEFVEKVRKDPEDGFPGFDIRIGIHTGPVIAGVVGTKKFAYDIWGDTVNVASRMESSSAPGRINISETTYALVRDQFKCTYRGEVEVKNKGMLKMYYVKEVKVNAPERDQEEKVSTG